MSRPPSLQLLPTELRERHTDAALASGLDELLVQARRVWPELAVPNDAFVPYVAARLPPEEVAREALAKINAADLYLACACTRGDPQAHRAFVRQCLGGIEAVVVDLGPVDLTDFRQRLCEHVLVAAPPRVARIASFAGRGELVNWVRITARRLVIDELRARALPAAALTNPSDPELIADGPDPELGLLKEVYRDGFRLAIEDAFGRLSARERTLLRYRFVDRLEVAQIASVAGRHRVSVSRSLGKAHQRLLAHVRRHLVTRLRIHRSEAESLIRLMRSQVEVSVSRLLRRDDPSRPA